MSFFSDNIRTLRVKHNMSQDNFAKNIFITRGRYVKYEDGTSEPPYDILKKIAYYYHISIDLLLSADVRKIDIQDLLKLENNRLLLPVMINSKEEKIIEVVTEKMKAGYLNGYANPEYIESLQQILLPFLGIGNYRGFPVEGNSMPPHENGTIIIGRYLETLRETLEGKTYILITKNEGIVYRRLNKNKKSALILESDNYFYQNHEVRASDILEIWEYQCHIGHSDRKLEISKYLSEEEIFLKLKRENSGVRNCIVNK
jgi:transcriptional regulator with XRE-family HTH domain